MTTCGNTTFRKVQPQPVVFRTITQNTSSPRAVSPTRVVINNKSFDIGALKSQIVYVAPLTHKATPKKATEQEPIRVNGKSRVDFKVGTSFPSELVIQE